MFRRQGSFVAVRHFTGDPDPKSEDGIKRRRLLLGRSAGALFARVVVVAEGETEGSMLPVLAEAWWERDGGAHARGVEFVSSDGAGSARHVVPALEMWGVPWWCVVDGDAAGIEALNGVSNALGRTIEEAAPEVVVLRPCTEEYLLSLPGYRDIVFEVGGAWPDEGINDWRLRLHGQRARGGVVRDYHSVGWEDRVALDWLRGHKGTVGAPLGRAIVSVREAENRPRLPPLIRDLFDRIDARLSGAA